MGPQTESISTEQAFIKPLLSAVIGPPWLISLLLLAVLASVRFYVLFSPYQLQELFFAQMIGMWALPFVILTASGRREIGLSERGATWTSFLLSALAGSACALLFFLIGMMLYGNTPNNWCVSIRNYLHFDELRGLMSPGALFALYAVPAMFLNPVGEEVFFRGFLYQSFARRFNTGIATAVSSLLFGMMYLSIHGIWRDAAGFHIRLASTALALLLMSSVGGVFKLCRTRSGSLWPAVCAHAAFSLTMLAAIIHQFLR